MPLSLYAVLICLCVVTGISRTLAMRSPGPQACKTPEDVSHDMTSRCLSWSREVNATMAKLVQTITQITVPAADSSTVSRDAQHGGSD